MSCDASPNSNGVPNNGFSQEAGYVVGPSGEQLTEVDGSGNWLHTNVYAGGKLIGTYDGSVSAPTLHFHIDDPLGTRRAQVSATGVLEATYQSLPFGDGLNPIAYTTTADDPTENHFTGKERDSESGNDYFLARYYGSIGGRFLSPDPLSGSVANPQSLNHYVYALNNPLRFTDPTGKYTCTAGTDECAAIEKARNAAMLNAGDDPAAAFAAMRYGSPTDKNKIYVGVSTVREGAAGETKFGIGANGKADGTVNVTFSSTLIQSALLTGDNLKLQQNLVHEGTHVAQDEKLIESHFNLKNDITIRKAEEGAYQVQENYSERQGVGDHRLESKQAIDEYISSHPDLYPHPDNLILPLAQVPSQK
jgi:RHS repeat-associated protein